MDSFNDVIRQLQLFDVPLQQRRYTWTNKHPAPIFSRIDRVFLTTPVLQAFQLVHLSPGPMITSDHVPLLLRCSHLHPTRTVTRLEHFWMKYDEFQQIIDQTFTTPLLNAFTDPIDALCTKLTNLHTKLHVWHNEKFAGADTYLDNCRKLIKFFDTLEELRNLMQMELYIRIKVKERNYELAANDEVKWHHRARCRWLKSGDRNTTYFHALASSRFRKKTISKLHHLDRELTNQDHILQAFLSHFQTLMGTRKQTAGIDLTTLYTHPHDLAHLDLPFTAQEVLQAVKDLAPNKASGPDGLPNEFIKQSWPALQQNVIEIFHHFHSELLDLTPINEGRIVLVPKSEIALTVTDFRPISVINLIPKLLSKVLANRMKQHMTHLVSEHQTAFLHGRYIVENFLATRELVHHVHHSKSPTILLKLDFMKAFDTLD